MAADLASFDLDATMRYVNVPCSYLVVLPHATSYSRYPFSTPLRFLPCSAPAHPQVEYFAAASLALGWLVGGALSGACSDEWRLLDVERRWKLLRTGC